MFCSCVGVWQNDRVEIIANDQGNRTTPSYVGFTDTERLIGDAAKNQVAMNPRNTVFDAKRLIGRKFNDTAVQQDMKHWPFTVLSGPEGKPIIEGKECLQVTATISLWQDVETSWPRQPLLYVEMIMAVTAVLCYFVYSFICMACTLFYCCMHFGIIPQPVVLQHMN